MFLLTKSLPSFFRYFQPCHYVLNLLRVATALSFSTDDSSPQPIQSPGGSSTASSRDASPSREISPLVNSLKPPTIIRRGPQGFGFTIRAIRVYFGDSDYYTVHHLVMVSLLLWWEVWVMRILSFTDLLRAQKIIHWLVNTHNLLLWFLSPGYHHVITGVYMDEWLTLDIMQYFCFRD